MIRVVKHSRAWQDLSEIARFISADSPAAALRFLDQVERTIEFIARHPRAARLRRDLDPPFDELRSRPVEGFPNHLIFYRLTGRSLAIVRVLHGASDFSSDQRA